MKNSLKVSWIAESLVSFKIDLLRIKLVNRAIIYGVGVLIA